LKNPIRVSQRTKQETGWYDAAMVGIIPAGWYDWTTKAIELDTPSLKDLRPLLKQARDAGMGLIGMKAARYLAPMTAAGKGDETAFDKYYDRKFLESPLNPASAFPAASGEELQSLSAFLCICAGERTGCGECGYAEFHPPGREY